MNDPTVWGPQTPVGPILETTFLSDGVFDPSDPTYGGQFPFSVQYVSKIIVIDDGTTITDFGWCYGDNDTPVFAPRTGGGKGNETSFTFGPNEVITDMTIFLNGLSGDSAGIGCVTFRTNVGNVFKSGGAAAVPAPIAVGSGILIGFAGMSGNYLRQLSPLFLKPVSTIIVTPNPLTPSALPPPSGASLDYISVANTSPEEIDWTLHRSRSVSAMTKYELSHSVSETNSIQVKVNAQVLGVGFSGQYEWTRSSETATTYTTSETTTEEVSWDVSGKVPAGSTISASANIGFGIVSNLPVQLYLLYKFADGSTLPANPYDSTSYQNTVTPNGGLVTTVLNVVSFSTMSVSTQESADLPDHVTYNRLPASVDLMVRRFSR